jgi:hypothetical protein
MPGKKLIDERKLLLKYKNGSKVSEKEYPIIESYASIGVIKLGYSFRKRQVQASLTTSGKRLLGLTE